jgi:ABC-type spermidine/putrescine transport system permease subunit II
MPIRHAALTAFAVVAFALVYLPIGLVVLTSFSAAEISSFPIKAFTLRWYADLAESRRTLDSLWTSLLVAGPATVAATAVGVLAALPLVRYEFPGKRLFLALMTMPMLAPGIILGVSMLLFIRSIGFTTGYLAILLGHTVLAMPYCTFIVMASLARFDRTLEDAARGLGAGELSVFFRVTLPGISAGVIGAALFAFTISIGEFIVTFFLTSAGTTTLPVRIYSIVRVGITPEINAISSLILLVTLISAVAGVYVGLARRR